MAKPAVPVLSLHLLEGQFLQKCSFITLERNCVHISEDIRVINAIYFYVVFWLCLEISYVGIDQRQL
jgi:hypothetical protein